MFISLDEFNSLLYMDDNNLLHRHWINLTDIVISATEKVECNLAVPCLSYCNKSVKLTFFFWRTFDTSFIEAREQQWEYR